MRSLFLSIFPIVIFLSLTPAAANAQLYKWVDEDGKTHFSDQPPIRQKAEKLNMPKAQVPTSGSGSSDADRSVRRKQLLETMAADRKKREDSRADKKQKKQEKAERCKYLLAKKKKAQRANHFYTTDENGERQYFDEKKAEAIRRRAIENYQQECGSK